MPPDPSSYKSRPSLGESVDAVLCGWRRAAGASSPPALRIRALLTVGELGEWELGWRNGVIHRILATGASRPATTGEQEVLRTCILHGWFYVYLAQEHQEPVVLHAAGIETSDSPEVPLVSALTIREGESGAMRAGSSGDEMGRRDGETPLGVGSFPMQPARSSPSAGKHPVYHRLVLLLLSGVVAGSGVTCWLLTGRSEYGVALAVLVSVLLGCILKRAIAWR